MNNRTLIGGVAGLAVAAIFAAILIVGTRTVAQEQAGPSAAVAATGILAFDREAILRNSAAGKDMLRQIEELRKAGEAKYGDEEKKLRADAQELQEQAGVLSADARQKKEKELRERGAALQKKVQEEEMAIRNGVNQANAEIEKALRPILNAILAERKATVMLDRGVIIVGSVDIDVTANAIQRLDQVLPAVKVTPSAPQDAAPAEGQ